MEVAGKDIVHLKVIEIGELYWHVPLIALIAEIAPRIEGVEQLAVKEHDMFLVGGQTLAKGMELIEDLFSLRRLKGDPPYQVLSMPLSSCSWALSLAAEASFSS